MPKIEIKTLIHDKEISYEMNINKTEVNTHFLNEYSKEEFLDFVTLLFLLHDQKTLIESLVVWGETKYQLTGTKFIKEVESRLNNIIQN